MKSRIAATQVTHKRYEICAKHAHAAFVKAIVVIFGKLLKHKCAIL